MLVVLALSTAALAGATPITEPTVTLVENTTLPPALPPEDTLGAVRARNTVMRICYEMAVEDDPTLAGQVRLEMHWASAGAVQRVKINWTSLGNPDTATCVAQAAAKIKFPAGDPARTDPYFASFTWLFEPGTAPDAPDVSSLVAPCLAAPAGEGFVGLTIDQDADGKVTSVHHTHTSNGQEAVLGCLSEKLDGAAITATGEAHAWRYAWTY